MDLNINIDPEEINKMVAEAVLNSAIGDQVKVQVQKNIDQLAVSYKNPTTVDIDMNDKPQRRIDT